MAKEQFFQVGMRAEQTFQVTEADTAAHIGSGSLRVLATPSMIGFMERVARSFMDDRLPEGFSSVGVRVDVRHLAATQVGGEVRVRCEVIEVNGRRIDFSVEARDASEKIGEGVPPAGCDRCRALLKSPAGKAKRCPGSLKSLRRTSWKMPVLWEPLARTCASCGRQAGPPQSPPAEEPTNQSEQGAPTSFGGRDRRSFCQGLRVRLSAEVHVGDISWAQL